MTPSIGLAPMHGVTGFAARLWFSTVGGVEFCSTPFLRVTPGFPVKKIPLLYVPELKFFKARTPYKLTPQIMASDPDDFIRIAESLLEDSDEVELNCGCPSPKVFSHGAGSSLLADVDFFYNFVHKISSRLGDERLVVKIRTGIADVDLFEDLVHCLNATKIKRLVIHGRTKQAGYTGKADWGLIKQASVWSHVPVRGSGDISHYRQLTDLDSYHYCESLIIGRGALRNPWLFSEIKRQQATSLTPKAIYYALGLWALLHWGASQQTERLLEVGPDFLAKSIDSTCEEQWEQLYNFVSTELCEKVISPVDLELDRASLGYLKMLWNYFRSSLPPEYFKNRLFRSKDAHGFFGGWLEMTEGCQSMELAYNPDFDWVYAGRPLN